MKLIDMHVHVVGNGARGSGCWLRPRGWQRPFGRFMLHYARLAARGFDDPEFDRIYIDRLLELVGGSSLDAIVILAQDDVYDEQGRVMAGVGTFYVPNDYVLNLARDHKEFLPAVSIHPARADALEELDRCLAAGAVMLKILPNCHNIDCNDRRYTKFWERMAEKKLPLLAHTGGEHTVQVVRADLQDPRVLDWPLQCGVTCIAAHLGAKGALFDQDYFDVFVEMTRRYPNFYGDLSACNVPTRSRCFRPCLQAPLIDHLVHGSDFPVPVFGHWAWLRGLVDWKTFRKWEGTSNVLERDYQLKKAMGYPESVFTRINGLLRLPD
jgi:hypothetical protein